VEYEKASGSIDKTVLVDLKDIPNIDEAIYTSLDEAILAFSREGRESNAETVFDKSSISASKKSASFQLAAARYVICQDLWIVLIFVKERQQWVPNAQTCRICLLCARRDCKNPLVLVGGHHSELQEM
jgi:hypothetical protein